MVGPVVIDGINDDVRLDRMRIRGAISTRSRAASGFCARDWNALSSES